MSLRFIMVLVALTMQLCGCAANRDGPADIDALERRHADTVKDVGCGRDGSGA